MSRTLARMQTSSTLLLAVSLSLGACVAEAVDDSESDSQSVAVDNATPSTKHIYPTRQTAQLAAPAVSQNGINYHGGSVMTSTHNTAYFIWYGNWSGNDAPTILENMVKHIGGSPWFNINTTYTNRSGLPIDNAMHFGGSINVDSSTHGTTLDDAAIQAIVSDAVTGGKLPKSANGIYFVLTSSDIMESSGFCSQYCGWHYFGTIDGLRLKYSFIGNPDQCPTACSAQQSSPNGNVGADGMASIIAHEMSETVSDPYVSAWTDSSGEENADKCAWTFGTETSLPNGSQYNVTFGSMNYLIQQNWVNANGGSCAMSF
jgi:hypothetical protein